MKIKLILALLGIIIFPGCKPNEEEQKAKVQQTAEIYCKAFTTQDEETLKALLDENMVNMIAKESGKTKEEVIDAMADSHVPKKAILVSMEPGTPGKIQNIKNLSFCFIPIRSIVKPDHSGKHFAQIPLFGPNAVEVITENLFVSKNGKKWNWIGSVDREALNKIYPQAKESLLFPGKLVTINPIY